jgi:hypothetical protein
MTFAHLGPLLAVMAVGVTLVTGAIGMHRKVNADGAPALGCLPSIVGIGGVIVICDAAHAITTLMGKP